MARRPRAPRRPARPAPGPDSCPVRRRAIRTSSFITPKLGRIQGASRRACCGAFPRRPWPAPTRQNPRRVRRAPFSSSTTSDSSGSRQLEARFRDRLAQHDFARELVRRDEVIVAKLLHGAITIDAHFEHPMRRFSRTRPAPPVARPQVPQARGPRAALLRAAARRSRRESARTGHRNLRIGVFSKT